MRVKHIASDWTRAEVELRQKLLNRNYVGTHFGGSLFAMTDPFAMILMMQQLGRGYVVWDRSASIEFIRPGRGKLSAIIEITPAMVDAARSATADGAKFEPTYAIEVKNAESEVVARVEKTLYIRRQKPAAPTQN